VEQHNRGRVKLETGKVGRDEIGLLEEESLCLSNQVPGFLQKNRASRKVGNRERTKRKKEKWNTWSVEKTKRSNERSEVGTREVPLERQNHPPL